MTWREQLALLRGQTEGSAIVSAAYRPTSRQILYVFDMDASRSGQGVIMQIGWQDRRTTGDWGRVQIRPYLSHELAGALDTSDVAVITLLEGAASSYIREIAADTPRGVLRNTYHLTPAMLDLLWPRLIATGRAMIRLPGPTPELPVITPAALDEGAPWELCLDVREMPSIESYRATLRLKRGSRHARRRREHDARQGRAVPPRHDRARRRSRRAAVDGHPAPRRRHHGADGGGVRVRQRSGDAAARAAVAAAGFAAAGRHAGRARVHPAPARGQDERSGASAGGRAAVRVSGLRGVVGGYVGAPAAAGAAAAARARSGDRTQRARRADERRRARRASRGRTRPAARTGVRPAADPRALAHRPRLARRGGEHALSRLHRQPLHRHLRASTGSSSKACSNSATRRCRWRRCSPTVRAANRSSSSTMGRWAWCRRSGWRGASCCSCAGAVSKIACGSRAVRRCCSIICSRSRVR